MHVQHKERQKTTQTELLVSLQFVSSMNGKQPLRVPQLGFRVKTFALTCAMDISVYYDEMSFNTQVF